MTAFLYFSGCQCRNMAKKSKKFTPPKDAAFPSTPGKVDEAELTARLDKEKETGFDPEYLSDVLLQFGAILTGMSLYSYQRGFAWRVFYAVLKFEGSVLTALWSRQSGKSETMAFVINTLTVLMPTLARHFKEIEQFKDGFRIGLFAPQSDQVWTTYNRAMLRLGTESAYTVMQDPDIKVELESDVRLELTNGSYLKGQIASKLSKIESATYDLVIAEESQDIDDYIINKSIEPMVTATGGTILKVGTTGTVKNHFWTEIQRNRNLDRKIKDERLLSHHEFDYKKVIKARREQFDCDGKPFHLHYEKIVKNVIERKGIDSEEFKLSYALKWSLETGMLITEDDWARMCNKRLGLISEADDDEELYAGLDIGKVVNSTVLTIGRRIENEEDEFAPAKKQIVAWIELIGVDYEAQHHIIMDILIKYNVKKLAGDYTGVGKAVLDRLMYACGEFVHIIPYTFSRQSKSEMWYKFNADIASKRFVVPANKAARDTNEFRNFEEQMKNCQKYHDGPYLVCEKLEGYMDDYVDSAALMGMAVDDDTQTNYEVDEQDNMFYGEVEEMRKRIQQNSY